MSRSKRFAELYTDIDASDWDDQKPEKEFHLWQLEYAIKNNNLDLLDEIIKREGV